MNEYERFESLMEEVDTLEHAIQYKLENMCPIKGTLAKIKYLENLYNELDRVNVKIELEHLEYREQHILENISEEGLDIWEELHLAKAKVEELEECILEHINEEILEELYEIREKQEMLEIKLSFIV